MVAYLRLSVITMSARRVTQYRAPKSMHCIDFFLTTQSTKTRNNLPGISISIRPSYIYNMNLCALVHTHTKADSAFSHITRTHFKARHHCLRGKSKSAPVLSVTTKRVFVHFPLSQRYSKT